ncbi:MAG TPA: hypothetical protein PK082_00845 [Phycisphaerae bacterium]|nr:hypothetical protein [Phycisphaerae bacterium]
MKRNWKILVCRCVHAKKLHSDVDHFSQMIPCMKGMTVVDDLCALAAKRDRRLLALGNEPDLRVVACRPRAVRWMLRAAGVDHGGNVRYFDFRQQPEEEDLLAILGDGFLEPGRGRHIAHEGDWQGWFPVIDRDRCTGCKQCLNFCLFGVYALSGDGRVEVREPARCKPHCPACARVCPSLAIMFPKHGERPIDGDEVRPEDLARTDLRVDPRNVARGDVLKALRDRQRRGPDED